MHLCRSASVIGSEGCGTEEEVLDVVLRGGVEIDIACDTCQSPIVLTLQERTAGEAEALHGNGILALLNLVGNIPLAGQIGILGISGKLTVHPHVVRMSGSAETDKSLAVLPTLGQRKGTSVAAHGVLHVTAVCPRAIAVCHHAVGAGIGKGVGGVNIQGLVPTLTIPDGIYLPGIGHGDVIPTGIVIVLGIETRGNTCRQSAPVELPCSVQIKVIRGLCEVKRFSALGRRERDAQVVADLTVQLIHGNIIPFRHRLRFRQ